LLVAHHLIIDAVSWRILIEDFHAVCDQLLQGKVPKLAPEMASYKQWTQALTEYANSPEITVEHEYWMAQQADRSMPCDLLTGANDVASEQKIIVTLGTEETAFLQRRQSSMVNFSIEEVLLAALLKAFSEWTGSQELLVDLEGHGREDFGGGMDISRTLGWFTAIYPIKLLLMGKSRRDHVSSIREQLRKVPHRGVRYGLLRYMGSGPASKALKGMPAPEVSFNYLGQFDPLLKQNLLFRPAPEPPGPARSPYAMRDYVFEISVAVTEGRLRAAWSYSGNRHYPETVQSLADHFLNTLHGFVAECQSQGVAMKAADFPLSGMNQRQLEKFLKQLQSETSH
jgi:non-ribosomal peptide synthase protein (TIGR01720 family)